MTIRRMDNVRIVVDDLEAVIAFFVELGMALEGKGPIEGHWAERVIGLEDVRQDVAMLRTPDGHGRVEPANVLARLRTHGAELVGVLEQYENICRLCCVRGPEGIVVGLAEQLG